MSEYILIHQPSPVSGTSEVNWENSQDRILRLGERTESIEELLRQRGFFDVSERHVQTR